MDAIDLEQQNLDEALERNIAAVVRRPLQVSAIFCEECDSAIPEARRRAIHGVTRCITCQEIAELKSRHYQGGR
ncbi:TraR/DksA C4-type zinc finger protein [Mixta tenebrionis]|uniref:TraR/DksA family transcriptional regulator n=1 Tax=Mixta tenebrionis TaxID=2562439 RepID=A0A506V6U1_9GAMM|nr:MULTISPECIES: TraR/DksA C4-type zinc finger protein [Mixta]QHM74094.1 hypothetical protein C7M52_00015 [Mixta theicola]TPW41070.1 TraR/DksA family transcriptional regulator [Mixta tenebrionis]